MNMSAEDTVAAIHSAAFYQFSWRRMPDYRAAVRQGRGLEFGVNRTIHQLADVLVQSKTYNIGQQRCALPDDGGETYTLFPGKTAVDCERLKWTQ